MSDNWDWEETENKELTIIPRVRAIAVYTNPRGEIVIRQEGMSLDMDDQYIAIPKEQIPTLIRALQEEAAVEG
ncbi:hypothetical protein [Chromobacterium haemolyticum]|uniref:hypothetical protein n=1 Tax=Chromobacterium haemolyticum TaxID=394935 RepID=UPI0005BDFC5B|nr:hypothetical protein [Chromobacterium haemolyticum]